MSATDEAAEEGVPAWKRMLPIGLLVVFTAGAGGYFLLGGAGTPEAEPEAAVADRPPEFDILPIDTRGFPALRRMPEPTPERVADVEPSTRPARAEEATRTRAEHEPERRARAEAAPAEVSERERRVAAALQRSETLRSARREAQGPAPLQEVGALYDFGPFQERAVFNVDRAPAADPTDPAAEVLRAALAAEQGGARAEREGIQVRRVGVRRPDGRVIEGRIVRNDRQAGQLIRQWLVGATLREPPPERPFVPAAERVHDEILRASGLAGVRVGQPVAFDLALVQNRFGNTSLAHTACPGPDCGLRAGLVPVPSLPHRVAPLLHIGQVVLPRDLSPFEQHLDVAPLGLGLEPEPSIARLDGASLATFEQLRLFEKTLDRNLNGQVTNIARLRPFRTGPRPLPPLDGTRFTFYPFGFERSPRGASLSDVRRYYGPVYGVLLPGGQ